MAIYEVKKLGTTVQWTYKISEAESAFRETGPGDVQMYRLVGTVKQLIQSK